MNRIKVNIQQKLIVSGLAIALTSLSGQAVNAQNLNNQVPEIGWASRLSSLGLNKPENIDKTYDFYCQPASNDISHEAIWGTKVYTPNSVICSTAIHAGMIDESGGIVSLKLQSGQEFYTGSRKNRVASKDHPGTNLSFTFVSTNPAANNPHLSNQNPQQGSAKIEKVMLNTVQRGLERSIEKAILDIFN